MIRYLVCGSYRAFRDWYRQFPYIPRKDIIHVSPSCANWVWGRAEKVLKVIYLHDFDFGDRKTNDAIRYAIHKSQVMRRWTPKPLSVRIREVWQEWRKR